MTIAVLTGVKMRLAIAVPLVVLLSACGRDNQYVAPPPPVVTVMAPQQKPVTRYLEATGNTAAVNQPIWSRACPDSCRRSSIRTAPS